MKVGEMLPEFTLLDQDGTTFSSHQYIGAKNMVLFFYPMNGTPICTLEACSFRNKFEIFKENDFEVIGISSDSKKSHRAFKKMYHLPYRLLSDEDGKVRRLLKVPRTFLGLLPGRVTYVVNKEERIIKIYSSFFGSSSHVKEAIAAVQKAPVK